MELDDEELEATRNKSADKMFEELGYEIKYYNYKAEEIIEETQKENATVLQYYAYYDFGEYTETRVINIYLEDERIVLPNSLSIDIEELKAINKKVEELGW